MDNMFVADRIYRWRSNRTAFHGIKNLPSGWLRRLATAYIWLFQSIPLLMLLFLTGLKIPAFFKIDVPAWLAATVSLTLFQRLHVRSRRERLNPVPKGQWEGGRALGLGFNWILYSIVAPQALRIATPPTVRIYGSGN